MSQIPLFQLGPKPANGEETKVCSSCDFRLPLDAFTTSSNYAQGRYHACKACVRDHAAVVRPFRAAGGFELLIQKQAGHCGICPSAEDLCVDVDHKVMRVRGLLCRKCNIMLAQLEKTDAVVRYLSGGYAS